MPLSWNEIKSRAAQFTYEWKDTVREEAEAKPFLIEFLNIFGISRKRVATFEHRVKKINDAQGYIDLLWPGTLLVEMKSRGQDLEKAHQQLDKAVDLCYRPQPFQSEAKRIEYLFELYEHYASGLFVQEKKAFSGSKKVTR